MPTFSFLQVRISCGVLSSACLMSARCHKRGIKTAYEMEAELKRTKSRNCNQKNQVYCNILNALPDAVGSHSFYRSKAGEDVSRGTLLRCCSCIEIYVQSPRRMYPGGEKFRPKGHFLTEPPSPVSIMLVVYWFCLLRHYLEERKGSRRLRLSHRRQNYLAFVQG